MEADPFVPDENVKPVVEPNVSLPCVTVSFTVSELAVAAVSAMLIALELTVENVSEAFFAALFWCWGGGGGGGASGGGGV